MTRSLYKRTPSWAYTDSQMGYSGARERLLRARLGVPCLISFRSELRAVSKAVSLARRDHEMVPMS